MQRLQIAVAFYVFKIVQRLRLGSHRKTVQIIAGVEGSDRGRKYSAGEIVVFISRSFIFAVLRGEFVAGVHAVFLLIKALHGFPPFCFRKIGRRISIISISIQVTLIVFQIDPLVILVILPIPRCAAVAQAIQYIVNNSEDSFRSRGRRIVFIVVKQVTIRR